MNFFNNQIKQILLLINTILLIIILFLTIQTPQSNSVIQESSITKEPNTIIENNDKVNNKIKIDVKGEVNNPGVYEVEYGTIINEVITLAGGLKETAQINNINLSKKVQDEMVIYIYTNQDTKNIEEQEICYSDPIFIDSCTEEKNSLILPNEKQSTIDNKISINKSTKEELMQIPGIGEVKATAIISYRDENGPFKIIEEIKKVNGISDNIYEKIKEYIKL